jgi:hypothetical protein
VSLGVFLGAAWWLIPAYLAAGAAFSLSLAVAAHVIVLILFLRPEFVLPGPLLLTTGFTGSLILLAITYYELSLINWGF